MPSLLVRHADVIYRCDDARSSIRDGYVHVENGRIVAVGREPAPPIVAEEQISAAGCIVTPGLVNIHHHLFQTLTRAVPRATRATIVDWLATMYPIWAEIDAGAYYHASLATNCELLASGCTTNADFAYLMPEAAGEMAAEEVRGAGEAGIRFVLVRGGMPTIEADLEQRLAPIMGDRLDRLLDREETLFPKLEAAIRRYHDTSPGAMVQVAIGPTSVTYRRPQFMRRFAELAKASACGLHVHFDPRPDERAVIRERGSIPIEFLRAAGWLSERTWLAHATLLDDSDTTAIADAGTSLAHCPRCIVRLGKKVARIGHWRAHGINAGIGVDGAASSDMSNMLNELRLALVLHRVGGYEDTEAADQWLTPQDALWMATRGGARALGRDDIGQLSPGKAADIAAFPLRRLSHAGAVADPLGALLLAGSDPYAALTIVNGRVRVRDGRMVDVDEARALDGANAAAMRLLQAATTRTGIDFAAQPSGLARA
ncbi:MAG TPA: amidohydrolase family protein [Casimicrobiaceae bacterium]|nr:amidohydrolase family protein [Casimicrobiaceae bacterium]